MSDRNYNPPVLPSMTLDELSNYQNTGQLPPTEPRAGESPRFKVGQRVFWNDPDAGLCSGWASIAEIKGDGDPDDLEDQIFVLTMEGGAGETEAVMSELSEVAPTNPRAPRITYACPNCGQVDAHAENCPSNPRAQTATREADPDNDEFHCADCNRIMDIEFSVRQGDELICEDCNESPAGMAASVMAAFNLSDEQYDTIKAIAPDNTAILATMVKAHAELKNQHTKLVAALRGLLKVGQTLPQPATHDGLALADALAQARTALANEPEGGE